MKKAHKERLAALGRKQTKYTGLDTFPKPKGLAEVTMTSDEVAAVCPVTGQPDWYTVKVVYFPAKLCIESKSMKLFLQSFRNKGVFCEKLATVIVEEVRSAVRCHVNVYVTQKSRGGISIVAYANAPEESL